jgi:hypothetical protein
MANDKVNGLVTVTVNHISQRGWTIDSNFGS